MRGKINRKTFLEFSLYAGLILVLAVAVRAVVLPAPPQPAKPLIPRSSGDAKMLEEYLHWSQGTPTLVEFMDFQCPPCRGNWPSLKKFLQAHPQVRYRAVNFPLVMHELAFPAAVAAQIAKAHGAYDRTFDDLFSGTPQLAVNQLNAYLSAHHMPAIVGTAQAKPFEGEVRQDMAFGEALHIQATPTLLLISGDGSLTEVHSLDAAASLVHG